MTKWVISDLHLGHKNILKYSGEFRGGTTSEEHDVWLIEQWNSVVKKCDLVYVLGDFAINMPALRMAKQLKGQKVLVRGNHDKESAQHYLEYFNQVQGLLSYKGIFWLSHAPIHPQELRGRINIHGHVHQNVVLKEDGSSDDRYISACVEATYGIPQNLDELQAKWGEIIWKRRKELWEAEHGNQDL